MPEQLTPEEQLIADAALAKALAKAEDAKRFLYENYHEHIDPLLDEIATTIFDYDVPIAVAANIASLMAEVSAINFAAGMRYAEQERLSR